MKSLVLTLAAVGVSLGLIAGTTFAAGTIIVTPADTQGWSTADTRPGGEVTYISDKTGPYPTGALRLTTDATTTAKAQYMKVGEEKFTNLNSLAYSTKYVSGPEFAAASYQLVVDLNGADPGGFTTFIYEPYQNGTVDTTGAWQTWDVDAGQIWSSRSFSEGTCMITAGGGGAPFYTVTQLQQNCPNAVVLGFGVNIGSNNPSYDVLVDGVVFQDSTYNFEVEAPASTPTPSPTIAPTPGPKVVTTADECKKGGYATVTTTTGETFKNQGQCVSYVNTQKSK